MSSIQNIYIFRKKIFKNKFSENNNLYKYLKKNKSVLKLYQIIMHKNKKYIGGIDMKLKKSHYNYFVENEGEFIGFNTRTLAMTVMNSEEMKKFKDIQDGKEKSEEFEQELYELGFLVDHNSNEKEILKYRFNKGRFGLVI